MPASRFDSEELALSPKIAHKDQAVREGALLKAGVVQPGIGFPSPSDQTQLLIVRLNLAPTRVGSGSVAEGLKRLCRLFADIDSGTKRIEVLNPKTGRPEATHLGERFNFSATIGFGEGFFGLQQIPAEKRPGKLKTMPDHEGLGDTTPYSLGQTDMILQLGSSSSFVNRWVLENTLQPKEEEGKKVGDQGEAEQAAKEEPPADIVTAVSGWATIADIHAGFQRTDGRNLQGFNDGVSNPRALSDQFNAVVWSMDEPNPELNQGTYMVFQKIIHDLDQWRDLDVDEQQEWVGRSKGTGLLLGTFATDKEDGDLADALKAGGAEGAAAFKKWKQLFDLQSHPELSFFSPELVTDPLPVDVVKSGFAVKDIKKMAERISQRCPAWSHVRKVNPRGADGAGFRLLFRRGYPFMESGQDNKIRSGLLFVSFQNDIEAKFEFIKRQWAGNPDFPVRLLRKFAPAEVAARRRGGRLTADEVEKLRNKPAGRDEHGLSDPQDFESFLTDAGKANRQQTGREGLAGPSEHGVTPTGEFLALVPLGGGYYFVPPIPGGKIENIGQQFFGEVQDDGTPGDADGDPYQAAMNVVVKPKSTAEQICRRNAGMERPQVEASAGRTAASTAAATRGRLVPGLPPTPEHNLQFRGGRTIANLVFANFYAGGDAAWKKDDRDQIDKALAAAMSDRRLNVVIGQYFGNRPITSSFRGPSPVLDGPRPQLFSRGNVEALVLQLAQAGQFNSFDLPNTVFNFMLPSGTELTTNEAPANAETANQKQAAAVKPKGKQGKGGRKPVADTDENEKASSRAGLGGYHGSVIFGTQRLYYAVGAFSERLADGTQNGIVAFNVPWKNVVATFYHELCEARTDPDVEEANKTGNRQLVGWTSAQGEEIGDFPIFEDDTLTHVFKEVPLADGSGTVPIQFEYSNRVHGPEDPTLAP